MRTVLEWLAAAVVVGVLALCLASCTDNVRVEFVSCQEARDAGAPLPLAPGEVGWNPALDTDRDGQAC